MSKTIDNIEQLQDLIQIGLGAEDFIVKSIKQVKHRPHPYTIGSGHVHFASEHFGGVLGEEAVDAFERGGGHCGAFGCKLKRAEHTYEYALFLQLKRNITNAAAVKAFMKIKLLLERNDIAGIAFVESLEGYRISPPKTKPVK